MGPLQRRKDVVEHDLAEILLDSWHAITADMLEVPQPHPDHPSIAKSIIEAADMQDATALEEALLHVQAAYDDHTLGDVTDRVLIYTVQKGWAAACKLCVKYNADINAQDEDNGGTPLMYAIHNAHDHIVETLLQLGADMEHEEQQGYTPLMVACLSDNATACEMLLDHKAMLDQTDSKGRTALSMACRYGSLECVKVLTSRGANVSHRDEDGMSVLEHAEQNDRRQVVGLIKRAQLANQMRQRRKMKNQHKDDAISTEEFERREMDAAKNMERLLEELEREQEDGQARRARQRAKRVARRKFGRRGFKDDCDLGHEGGGKLKHGSNDGGYGFAVDGKQGCKNGPMLGHHHHHHHHHQALSRAVSSNADAAAAAPDSRANSSCMDSNFDHASQLAEEEQLDRFGCTAQEAAELAAFRRVLLAGRLSPEEAIWQWGCAEGEDEIQADKLRKMWDFMVDAASHSLEPGEQDTFLNIVSVLLEVCTNHGVGVKQGKKVKQRLEKVGPVRGELEAAMKPPVDTERLHAAIEATRHVTSLLQSSLLDRARAAYDKALQEPRVPSPEREEVTPVVAPVAAPANDEQHQVPQRASPGRGGHAQQQAPAHGKAREARGGNAGKQHNPNRVGGVARGPTAPAPIGPRHAAGNAHAPPGDLGGPLEPHLHQQPPPPQQHQPIPPQQQQQQQAQQASHLAMDSLMTSPQDLLGSQLIGLLEDAPVRTPRHKQHTQGGGPGQTNWGSGASGASNMQGGPMPPPNRGPTPPLHVGRGAQPVMAPGRVRMPAQHQQHHQQHQPQAQQQPQQPQPGRGAVLSKSGGAPHWPAGPPPPPPQASAAVPRGGVKPGRGGPMRGGQAMAGRIAGAANNGGYAGNAGLNSGKPYAAFNAYTANGAYNVNGAVPGAPGMHRRLPSDNNNKDGALNFDVAAAPFMPQSKQMQLHVDHGFGSRINVGVTSAAARFNTRGALSVAGLDDGILPHDPFNIDAPSLGLAVHNPSPGADHRGVSVASHMHHHHHQPLHDFRGDNGMNSGLNATVRRMADLGMSSRVGVQGDADHGRPGSDLIPESLLGAGFLGMLDEDGM